MAEDHGSSLCLTGRPASTGLVEGVARVVVEPLPPDDAIAQDEILVVPFSTPFHYALFLKAGGIVAEHGGLTSHAAGLARELGLPCVVAVEGAVDQIPDGAVVRVDGTEGTVEVR